MGKALLQISHSPFSWCIKQAELPHHFNQPTFTIYNGKTDPVEHMSHFNQRMAIHLKNKALMCKVFLSSLGLVAMRWFDSLEEGSIHSYKELTRAFWARFVTCSWVPRPLDSLWEKGRPWIIILIDTRRSIMKLMEILRLLLYKPS